MKQRWPGRLPREAVLVVACTNPAAAAVDGWTIHKGFNFKTISLREVTRLDDYSRGRLSAVKVLLVDEANLIEGREVLQVMEDRFREVREREGHNEANIVYVSWSKLVRWRF